MVYVTGDFHGEIKRFNGSECGKLKKGDTLVVCGDFGFVWEDTAKEKKLLKKIGKKKFNTLFVTGCHDNYGALAAYPEEEWCGGRVRKLSGNLRQLCRGEVYEIEGKKYFAFGGGESADGLLREENDLWWPEEQPTAAEETAALERLAAVQNEVDYIITHDAPLSILEFLNLPLVDVNSRINNFLEEVGKAVSFRQWFFGKLHQDKVITNRHRAVYLKLVPVEAAEKVRGKSRSK